MVEISVDFGIKSILALIIVSSLVGYLAFQWGFAQGHEKGYQEGAKQFISLIESSKKIRNVTMECYVVQPFGELCREINVSETGASKSMEN